MNTETRHQIAQTVCLERVRQGLSKEAAARKAGISSITWKRVEDGMAVQDTKLGDVEKALGWSPGYLTAYGRRPEAEVIKAAAKSAGLTDAEVAEKAGVSIRRYREATSGELLPDGALVRIAEALDVEPGQLREVGRPDAADQLLRLVGRRDSRQWPPRSGDLRDRLARVHDDLGLILDDLMGDGPDEASMNGE